MDIQISPCGGKYYTDGRPEISCLDIYGGDYKKFLIDFIPYLESKPDSEWVEIIFANKDTSKRCVIFHFMGFVGQDYPGAKNNENINWYHELICPIDIAGCRVNDGNHPEYQHKTPKERSLAYLKNLLEGRELNLYQMLDKHMSKVA